MYHLSFPVSVPAGGLQWVMKAVIRNGFSAISGGSLPVVLGPSFPKDLLQIVARAAHLSSLPTSSFLSPISISLLIWSAVQTVYQKQLPHC